MKYIYGDRIGRTGELVVGCSAVVLDAERGAVLLTQRTDNRRWCLPSGAMEAGESTVEACVRETLEETGLTVEVTRLIGIFSDPNVVSEYADGNRYQVVGICYEARVLSGEPRLSDETLDVGFVDLADIDRYDILEPHRDRIHLAIHDGVTFK